MKRYAYIANACTAPQKNYELYASTGPA